MRRHHDISEEREIPVGLLARELSYYEIAFGRLEVRDSCAEICGDEENSVAISNAAKAGHKRILRGEAVHP